MAGIDINSVFPNSKMVASARGGVSKFWSGESGIDGSGGGPVAPGPEATAFLARTSGLNTTHTNAYTDLINGLVSDGIWTKFDVLHIYATQDSTTALLNLVSTSYNGVASGSPTFTADLGFVGGAGKYIGTGFIATTAPSPKFVRDSAHISVWNLTNALSGGTAIGATSIGNDRSNILPKYTDGLCYLRINGGGSTAGVAMPDARGHFFANRSSSAAVQGYRNGVSISPPSDSSVAVSSVQFLSLAYNNNGTPQLETTDQIAQISIGSSLTATDVTNFYNRLRTYMTAVGVP